VFFTPAIYDVYSTSYRDRLTALIYNIESDDRQTRLLAQIPASNRAAHVKSKRGLHRRIQFFGRCNAKRQEINRYPDIWAFIDPFQGRADGVQVHNRGRGLVPNELEKRELIRVDSPVSGKRGASDRSCGWASVKGGEVRSFN
jgi:hypothetical protein